MKTTSKFSFLFILLCLQSCAQKNETETTLKLTNIYETTKDNVNQSLEKYGLKGKVKTVEQQTYTSPKDSIIDFSKYELIDPNQQHQYPNLAEMDNDCKVNFNKLGKLTDRISYGERFASKSVTTDTLLYDEKNELKISRNHLTAGERTYFTEMKFEYDQYGHLVKQYANNLQTWQYSYIEAKNQVRIVNYDDKEFRSDNLYTYNKFGKKIENQAFNEDKTQYERWVYEYDENGETKKETLYQPDGTPYEYLKKPFDKDFKIYQQYDKNENWTTKIIVNPNDKKLTIIKRKFEYYL